MIKQLELVLQDQKQSQVQNPCTYCVDWAEELGFEAKEAEFDYETIIMGIRICYPLCREHYLDVKAMEYER